MIPRCVLVLAVLVAPRFAMATTDEPRGFGKALFGMSVEDTMRVFPQLKKVSSPPEGMVSVPLAIYVLEKQSYLGLEPCDVGFRFHADHLYEVTFACADHAKVPETLKKHFGNPGITQPDAEFWNGEKTSIGLNTRAQTFSLTDRALNKNLQAVLLQYVITHQGNAQQVPTNPTPSAPVP